MKTVLEGRLYEVYGEPTRSMIEEFCEQGLGLHEDWPGEIATYYKVAGREISESAASAVIVLCQQA